MQQKPIPSLDWQITDRCNYRCEYCCEKQYDNTRFHYGMVDENTIQAVLEEIRKLPNSWQIKFSSGESTTHPKFLEICKKIAATRHTLRLTTNFSRSKEYLQEFIDISKDKLITLTASLHLSQIDIDSFIEKAAWYNERKNKSSKFFVTSVVTEQNFSQLEAIRKRLEKHNVPFRYQILKVNERHISYSETVEKAIQKNLIQNNATVKNRSFFGTKCHTGHLFFVIRPNADVYRCFEIQPGAYLGNIVKGTFQRKQTATPCLALKCSCEVAVNRNMVLIGKKETPIRTTLYGVKTLINDKTAFIELNKKLKGVTK